MRLILASTVLSLFVSPAAFAQKTVKAPEIIPAEAAPASVYYEKDWFDYYDDRLKDLGEPSFFQASKNPNAEAFRFFWMPQEGTPIILRIDVTPEGVATLTSKRSTGMDDKSWGKPQEETTRVLSEEELKDLRFKFGYMKYWYVERHDPDNVVSRPGPLWLYEAIEGGKYHAVERTNPAPGQTRAYGLLLLSFIEVDESEIMWPLRPRMN
jgi:hypothetical protein